MLNNPQLFRRHNERCNKKHGQNLGEDTLDQCDCNLGYKGIDPVQGRFRRLMFKPPTQDQRDAWKRIEDFEQGKTTVVGAEPKESPFSRSGQRRTIRDAFADYVEIVTDQRKVRSATIYSMFRPVGRVVVRVASGLGITYMDELGLDFAAKVLKEWRHLSVNVQTNYRSNFEDFCRIAKKNSWTALDLTERLERPVRGKGHTKPLNPTEPFDLQTELPKILAAIPNIDLGPTKKTKTVYWKKYPDTAKACLYLLYYSGLRKSDVILFDPRTLERRSETDNEGRVKDVYVRWVAKQKKTDAPVFVIIPFEVGEVIRQAPRFSEEYAFIPPGRAKGAKFRAWLTTTSAVLLPPLERASGVEHIHAHRFRDTFAVNLLKHGADIRFVSRALGHKNIAVTLNAYEHFLMEDQSNAVKTMLSCMSYM